MQKHMKTYTMSKARNELTAMPEKLKKQHGTTAITRRGKPVLAVMTWDLYESIMETLEILGDKKMTAALHRGIKEIAAGKGVAWKRA